MSLLRGLLNHKYLCTRFCLNCFFVFLGPLTETNYVVAEGQSVPRSAWRVSRADVAHFMLKSLQSNEWDNKGVAIAGKK